MDNRLEIMVTIHAEQVDSKPSKIMAEASGLSQAKIKDAMQKGAVWWQRGAAIKRLRRASKALQVGDVLVLNYDHAILNQSVPTPSLVHDAGPYSVWFKPFGMGCQGSRWGDFASLSRWVAMNWADKSRGTSRPVHLVHRLDRATTGLILLAHSKLAAQKFSQLFAEGQVDKRYQAIVHGDFSGLPHPHTVNQPIDDKHATSVFSVVKANPKQSLLDVQLLTGRKHQIRRHLSETGFPIVGDRLYGQGASDRVDLQLQAVGLSFICPFSGRRCAYAVDERQRLRFQ